MTLFRSEARRAFDIENKETPNKVALIRKQGRIIGMSPVFDYIYRAPELDQLSLYEWVTRCKRIKISTKSGKEKKEKSMIDIDASFETQNESFRNANTSVRSEGTDVSEILTDLDGFNNDNPGKKLGKNVYSFLKDHPLCDSHAL